MTEFVFKNAKISGISTIVPKNEKSLLDDPELYNGDSRRIDRVIKSSGFLKRRIADTDVTTSDLCYEAAKDLLSKLNIDKNTIDGLLFISYTPDYIMPATSYALHSRLKLNENCVVMDIPQACSGYIIGLMQAAMLINSGLKRILLLTGDTFSKFSDMFIDHTAPVFGDAGSATLIEKTNTNNMYFNVFSSGKHYDALICQNGGFRNIPKQTDFYTNGSYKYQAKMDGGRIFDFTMEKIAPSIESLLNFSKIAKEEINWFILHQANKFILENIARKLNISTELVPMQTLTKYGNQCGASIPCAISDTLKQEISTQKNRLLLSGFGVGLSWANAIVETDKIYCSGIIER